MPSQTRSSNTLLGVLGLVGFIAVVATAAYFIEPKGPSGHWPKEQRDTFIEACSKKCKTTSTVTHDRDALCDKGCACSADEAEKVMSSADLAQYYLAEKAGLVSEEQKEKIRKFTQASVACLGEAFGQKK
jgi:hypothetical protein